jgi:hypothetical protein
MITYISIGVVVVLFGVLLYLREKIQWIGPNEQFKVYTFSYPNCCGFLAPGLKINPRRRIWRLQGKIYKIGQGGPFIIDGELTGVFVIDEKIEKTLRRGDIDMAHSFITYAAFAQDSVDGPFPSATGSIYEPDSERLGFRPTKNIRDALEGFLE